MKKNSLFVLVFIVLLPLISCKTNTTVKDNKASASDIVCIWDKVSLRETPGNDGKWVTALSIGEQCMSLNEENMVANGEKSVRYLKVELKDGKQGWVQADFVVKGAAGVITGDATIYSRPDLLTKTDKAFSRMDIIGVKDEQNGFTEVTGKRRDGKWIETGWIKPENISTSEIDIAVAKYAVKALAVDDAAKRAKAIGDIVENPDLKGSVFIDELRSMMKSEAEQPEEIMDEMPEEAAGDTTLTGE